MTKTVEAKLIKRFEPFVLGVCKCGCGQEIKIKKKKHSELIKYVKGHNSKKENNPNWGGGFKKHRKYIMSLKPDHPYCDYWGYVRTHRLIEEHYLKILFDEDIYIPKEYDVHHINGIKNDNSLINLQLLSRSKHSSITNTKDFSDRVCLLCGSKTTRLRKDTGYYEWRKYKDGFICMKCFEKYYHRPRYCK